LDPFAGNFEDPQSLHKYLYTHGDPVNGIDPSGEFVHLLAAAALIGVIAVLSSATPSHAPENNNSLPITFTDPLASNILMDVLGGRAIGFFGGRIASFLGLRKERCQEPKNGMISIFQSNLIDIFSSRACMDSVPPPCSMPAFFLAASFDCIAPDTRCAI